MNIHFAGFKLLVAVAALFTSVTAMSQPTLDGLDRVADWTDLETTSNEMPSQIWGTCDAAGADRIGIRIEFDNGTSGSLTYSGVSGVWNTINFPGIIADSADGVFASCAANGLHFLNNNNTTLPMAWDSCGIPFASNFDLDYNAQNGSHFRADTAGWVSARIQTYCGAGAAAAPSVPVPTMTIYALALTVLGLVLVTTRRLRMISRRNSP